MTTNITPPAHSEYFTHTKYRPDIDGLRAIAILSVVGFHAFPFWVNGGFIGVDIFFVISGFLISTIIIGSLERNSFSFVEFYIRRIKRIFPALLLVLIACFAFGWFTLLADEYKQLGKHIAGGAGFISNFLFWNESGYFDNAAETKPLLHLWSLGVEEQFYIIWPLLLWFAWKQRLNLLTIAIVVGAISFALNINKVSSDAVAAFYSPQTRFWELMAGSVLAYLTLLKKNYFQNFKHRLDTWLDRWLSPIVYAQAPAANGNVLRNMQSLFGAALISVGIFVITKERAFPGWWAVLPITGSVLIISAGMHAWLNRVILSNRVLVWFGLISFPLYLWHWPLLSFARIVESDAPTRSIRIAVVLASVVLAWLTHELIEKPLRFGNYSKAKTIGMVVLMTLVGYVGYNTYTKDGLEFRFRDRSEFLSYFENERPAMRYFEKIDFFTTWEHECAYFDVQKYRENRLGGEVTNSTPRDSIDKTCFERDKKFEKSVMVWGDSHAQQLAPGLKLNLPKNWQMLQVASSGCSPNIQAESPSSKSQCDQSNYFAIKTIKEAKPDVVVVAQQGEHTTQGFREISAKLKGLGVARVVLVGPTPHWTSELPKLIAKQLWVAIPRRTYVGINKEIIDINTRLQSEFQSNSNQKYANVIDLFCSNDGCITYIGDDIKSGVTTWDYGHLTPVASNYLSKKLLVELITSRE